MKEVRIAWRPGSDKSASTAVIEWSKDRKQWTEWVGGRIRLDTNVASGWHTATRGAAAGRLLDPGTACDSTHGGLCVRDSTKYDAKTGLWGYVCACAPGYMCTKARVAPACSALRYY